MNTQEYKLPGKRPSILALIMMISLASVGAVLYSPSIPELNHYFHTSRTVIQLTMTLFLLGYALGQLFYGPLANRIGRRKSLSFGVGLGIISSLLCGLSAPLHSVLLLLIMRFILAIGAGVGLTVTITIINDFFHESQARVIFPFIAMSFAIIPGVAIFLGGLITYYLSWPDCFYFLAVYYFVALLVIQTLPETLPRKDLNALKLKGLIDDYWPLRKNWQLVGNSTLVAGCTLLIYVFSAQGPIIAKYQFGLNPATYGLLVLIPSACILLGNYVVSRLSRRFSSFQFIVFSLVVMGVVSTTLVTVVALGVLTIFSFFLLISLLYFVNPMLWNSASLLATQKVENKAHASAVLSFINVSGAVIGVFVAGIFAHSPSRTLSILYAVVILYMAFTAFYLNLQSRKGAG